MKTNAHTSPAKRLLTPVIPLAIGTTWACAASAGVGLVINEFSASTVGTDVEYVEIIGGASTDYSGYAVLEIEGDAGTVGINAGTIDEVIPLGTSDALGIYLANLPANALENGTLTLLLVQDNTGELNNDLDTNDDGVFDVTPWSAVIDAVSVNDGGAGDITYDVPVLGPNYDGINAFAPGGASRIPDGTDTGAASDWVRNDFDLAGIPGFTGTITLGEAYNTPGAPNQAYSVPIGNCGDLYTPIPDIQGSGANAAITGEVATEGIVVGDFEGMAAVSGFYLQDPEGDDKADTSDGIFVYTGSADLVSAGERVRVFGYARERFDQTTINRSNSNSAAVPAEYIKHCDSGVSVTPTDLMLPFYDATSAEAYEGMLVRLPQQLVIAEYFNYDRYGEIVLALPLPEETRSFQPTAIEEPGAAANGLALANRLARITLDDAQSAENPSTLRHPNGSAFSLTNRFRGGDGVQDVVGVLGYGFSLYRIYPTAPATYAELNPRPVNPEPVGGTLRVATMSTLNYFLTLDYPSGPLDNTCGPLQNVECRGADSDQPQELTRQRTKLVATLAGVGADIIGLTELENTPGVDALLDATYGLVPGLNEQLGSETYAAIETGVIGSDAIRVGLIYKPGTVTPVGDFEILDSSVDPRFKDTLNRPSLAQTFVVNATGARFSVVMNHLKSKGSSCPDDPDTGDGQGNCNLTRLTAAQALVDWLASDPTGSGDPDFLIMGDLNAYAMEDPIDAIKAGADDSAGTSSDNFTDLIAEYQGTYAYSYVFDGQAGYIDHLLASASLAAQATGSTTWHVNADEPDVFDYDTTYKTPAQDALYEPNAYRSSDHDPTIAGLQLCDDEDPTLSVTLAPAVLFPPNHKYTRVQATVTPHDNLDTAPEVTLLSVTSNEPDDAPGKSDGTTTDDIVIDGQTSFRLRAERDELGTGRIYTVTYRVTDECGNTATKAATVTVPIIR